MKQEIVNAFENVTMSAGCEQKIRLCLAEKAPRRRALPLKRLGTLAAVVALILCLSPEVRAAVSTVVEKYIFPDSGITIHKHTDEDGSVYREIWLDTESDNAIFAEIRDGRLYFTGNGENIDITDQIASNEPYFYTYTDEYGMEHHMAVGYTGSVENFGVYQFFRDENGWTNGYGINQLDAEGNRYPWIDRVWEELDIPWPLPGE